MSIISVKELAYYYPGKCALSEVDLSIQPNTITALVGPNGAGKSTLMRCLAGLFLPYHGKITIDNLDVLNFPRNVHGILGYLSDSYGLYEALTVYQCLKYQALAHNVPARKQENRIKAIAEDLKIQELLPQTIETLSKGQRQRIAIAQTLIHHPKILLLDEPATNLDPEARHNLAEILKKLRDKGVTIMVSSHILAELEDYCSHMIVLREGKIVTHCEIQSTQKSMMEVYLSTQTAN